MRLQKLFFAELLNWQKFPMFENSTILYSARLCVKRERFVLKELHRRLRDGVPFNLFLRGSESLHNLAAETVGREAPPEFILR